MAPMFCIRIGLLQPSGGVGTGTLPAARNRTAAAYRRHPDPMPHRYAASRELPTLRIRRSQFRPCSHRSRQSHLQAPCANGRRPIPAGNHDSCSICLRGAQIAVAANTERQTGGRASAAANYPMLSAMNRLRHHCGTAGRPQRTRGHPHAPVPSRSAETGGITCPTRRA